MKLAQIALTVLLSAAVAFGVAKYVAPSAQGEAKKETAFDRVMRTGTLRCGYLVLQPQMSRNPNTGALSGVSYDLVNEIAKRLELKVVWSEEVTFMTVAEGLKTGRYDALCFTAYRWVPSARAMEYTQPLFESTTAAYVRADDMRFDADTKALNNSGVTITTIDSEASTFIRAADYPESATYSLPANTDFSLALEAVATRKADVALANPLVAMPYLKANPDKLRRVASPPIRSYSHAFAFAKGEHDLTSMFNVVLDEMHNDGTINKILDRYEAIPDSFVRVKVGG